MELRIVLALLLLTAPLSAQQSGSNYNPRTAMTKLAAAMRSGTYCDSGLTPMPETTLQSVWRYMLHTKTMTIVHVTFARSCGPLDHWILYIRDVSDSADDVNIRTLNETPLGMDIEAVRGHDIDWRIVTR